MDRTEPITELDAPYSSPDATPTPWSVARDRLDAAAIYWLSTVRRDGRPHVTPVAAVWMDGSLYFSTGPEEQKSQNLASNDRCILTTGCNLFNEGLDVIVEGRAVRAEDETQLRRLVELFATKYQNVFGFTVQENAFTHDEGGIAHVFEVAPIKAFGYQRGETTGGATRYRF